MNILIYDYAHTPPKLKNLVKKVLMAACVYEAADEKPEVSIIFIKPEAMRHLNAEYRKIDQETDVLSFPADCGSSYGDIFINTSRAFEQAKWYDHTPEREMSFLAVHGFLHLLGYDHDTDRATLRMVEREKAILAICGLRKGSDMT